MKLIREFFTQIEMSWKLIIALSLACGVVPGLLMIPGCLAGTSLQMPGIAFEFWVFMGLFISLNCEKPLEAGLKVFVFFLVSQPIIYLVQVPFSWLGWGLFGYYPRWALITVLTFPAGMLANLIRRGEWWSAAILLIPMGILAVELPSSFSAMLAGFPKMSPTCLFIVAQLVAFPLLLQGRGERAASYVLIAVMVAASVTLYLTSDAGKISSGMEAQGAAPYTITSSSDDAEVSIENGYIEVAYSSARSKDSFSIPIEYEDAEGNVYSATFTKTAEDRGSFSEIEKE